ncbi:MAG: four helix bundle protein [Gammaproteobacteria bacterium]|nr:four helix bundle protein [Gammaproteobacteria bacterium]
MQFENLDVWKRSRCLSIEVYKALRDLKDYSFKDQVTRSVLSVPSNIAEGIEREYKKEKIRYLIIAKGSLGEFRTQIDIGSEIGYIQKDIANGWIQEAVELSKMLAAFIKTMENTLATSN